MCNCSSTTPAPRYRADCKGELESKEVVVVERTIDRSLLLPGRSRSGGVGWEITAVEERSESVVERLVMGLWCSVPAEGLV